MAEQEYFKKALAGLAFDTAAGDAIRHLADIGLTVAQIAEKLDYPVNKEKIGKIVWEHFLKRGHIRTEEPGSGVGSEEYTYVTEYDAYGRKSFRRVKIAEHGTERVRFLEKVFEAARFGEFAGYLRERCRENGEDSRIPILPAILRGFAGRSLRIIRFYWGLWGSGRGSIFWGCRGSKWSITGLTAAWRKLRRRYVRLGCTGGSTGF